MRTLRAAEHLLLELGIERPDQIDLEVIAWTSGASVNYRPLDQCEAMIVGAGRRAIISVNSNALPSRQRFSLAHEIGHWQLHRGRILICGKSDIENQVYNALNPESQADKFASDLILPYFMLRQTIAKIPRITLAAVRNVADEFQASLTATLLKVVDANYFPIVIVCHNKNQRRWFRRAQMVPEWWFPRGDLDPDSFAFDMLVKGAAESSFPQKIGADAWFEFSHAERYEVQEQSFLLPNGEVLTVLSLPEEALD